jgi:hypothetical protein
MKTKIKSIIILFLYVSYAPDIDATIIKEGYHFFDIFYYRDIYKNLIKQKKGNKCSIEDGPNCFYIKNNNKEEVVNDLKTLYPYKDDFYKEKPEDILVKIKEKTKLINSKENDLDEDEIFNFDSPQLISLYLTFESYDEITKNGDIYAPETMDSTYNLGRITLIILGKLRLSQKNSKIFENPTPKNLKDEGPKGTYAFVESKDVIIKFSCKTIISSVYIKRNNYNKDNKAFFLYGFKDGHKYMITKIQNVPNNRWLKITGDGKKYDSILLLRGFDYDNFVLNTSMDLKNNPDIAKFSKYSLILNNNINRFIEEAFNQIKNGLKSDDNNPGIKVIKMHLDPNDIVNEPEENFDLPEELLNELNKDETLDNNNNKEKQQDNNINKQDL